MTPVPALAAELAVHPYLAALGYAVLSSPEGEERQQVFGAWIMACERYGIDMQSRAELLAQIAEIVEPS